MTETIQLVSKRPQTQSSTDRIALPTNKHNVAVHRCGSAGGPQKPRQVHFQLTLCLYIRDKLCRPYTRTKRTALKTAKFENAYGSRPLCIKNASVHVAVQSLNIRQNIVIMSSGAHRTRTFQCSACTKCGQSNKKKRFEAENGMPHTYTMRT